MNITATSDDLHFPNYNFTWYVISQRRYNGEDFFLLENETYGDESPFLIVKQDGTVIVDDGYDGWSNLLESDYAKENQPFLYQPTNEQITEFLTNQLSDLYYVAIRTDLMPDDLNPRGPSWSATYKKEENKDKFLRYLKERHCLKGNAFVTSIPGITVEVTDTKVTLAIDPNLRKNEIVERMQA